MTVRGKQLARLIDISCVQAFHTADDVAELAQVARTHDFVAAHVLPHFVPLLKTELGPHSNTFIGAPIGFPSGGSTSTIKLAEARELVAMGAQELDLMINVGRLLSGETAYVGAEIRQIAEAIAPLPLKVLLEVAYLNDEQIRTACRLALEGGATFVKSGTGWAAGGAAIEKIETMSKAVDRRLGIKASGGIRDLAMIDALAALGVTRFGVNNRTAIALVTDPTSTK
jgi:deoxyribose-phosphate aldolase